MNVDVGLAVQKAQLEWTEFIEAQNSGSGEYIEQTYQSTTVESWKPPSRGVVKINADAAFSTGLDRNGTGIVARDWKGRLLKACVRSEA